MRIWPPLLSLLLAALALAGCVGMEPIKADVNDLAHETYAIKKQMTALQGELERVKAGDPRRDQALEAIRNSQSDILSQISSLQEDLQALRGQIEEEKHFTGKALDEQSRDSVEYRKKLDEKIAILAKEVSTQEERLTELEALARKMAAPRPEVPLTPENEYDRAYGLFTDGRFPESRAAFEEFIKRNPSHALAGNAQFWIGETNFREKDYAAAILAYEEVLKKYGTSRKAPAALYKQGLAFLEMKDQRVALAILNELVEKHPESEEAAQARAKLAELAPPKAEEKPQKNARPAGKTKKR